MSLKEKEKNDLKKILSNNTGNYFNLQHPLTALFTSTADSLPPLNTRFQLVQTISTDGLFARLCLKKLVIYVCINKCRSV